MKNNIQNENHAEVKSKEFSMLTMEFFNPCEPFSYATLQSHIQRYNFATSFVSGGKVLDIACGSGFGTSFLKTSGADYVLGGDVSPEAIGCSKQHYKDNDVEFLFLDGSRLPFRDSCFDVAVSFETLEHVPEYESFISELHRILKKGGKLVLSTPNKDVFSPGFKKPLRAHHIKEFKAHELKHLLLNHRFTEVETYGQLYANRISQLRWLLSFLLPSLPGGKLLAKLAMILSKDSRLLPADKSIGKSTDVSLDNRYQVSPWHDSFFSTPAILVITAKAN